ncbi:MAG: hypothetical protein B7X12_03060 [Halothiobacillus sp. 20-53-49]|nr:MAG: hypothetical protein B7X12_03060 [Halothiobacillus sp. 20-53-49]HUN00449.1 hypothetical protein [Halothiobacillus sp.]
MVTQVKKLGFRQTVLAVGIVCGLMSAGVMAADMGTVNSAAAPSAAQPAMPTLSPEQMKLMTDFKQTREAMDALEQQLQGIEAKAYDKNPKLAKDRDSLRDAIKVAMSDKTFDAQAKYDELKALVTKIQAMPDSDPQKAKDIQLFRAGQQEFEQRQEKAFQDPKIQQKSEKLRTDVRADMIKVDPKSKQLFVDLDAKEKHMHDLQQQAMQMHGVEQPMSPTK